MTDKWLIISVSPSAKIDFNHSYNFRIVCAYLEIANVFLVMAQKQHNQSFVPRPLILRQLTSTFCRFTKVPPIHNSITKMWSLTVSTEWGEQTRLQRRQDV